MTRFLISMALVIITCALASAANAQSLDDDQNYKIFKGWAINTQEPNPLPVMFDRCIEYYDKMIASGISPSTQVPEAVMSTYDLPRLHWKGTLKEIKENWCEAGKKKLAGAMDAEHAPYKAVLKADKLRLVLNEATGHIYRYALAGGKYTDDPKLLAAARVWFLNIGAPSNESQYCLNGSKRVSVRRYTFDAQHKLLGTTEKPYCGDPPAAAYR